MRICNVAGCGRPHAAKGYCKKHHKQFRRHGRVTNISNTTPNEIIVNGDICYMKLYDSHNFELVEKAIFDLADIQRVQVNRFALTGNGYVYSQKHGLLHHLILGRKKGFETDHINRDPLDNRRENLRFCTGRQNLANTGLMRTNKSGYRGVSWSKKDKTWVAQLSVDNKTTRVGSYNDKHEAAQAYNEAAFARNGEFAYQNQIKVA